LDRRFLLRRARSRRDLRDGQSGTIRRLNGSISLARICLPACLPECSPQHRDRGCLPPSHHTTPHRTAPTAPTTHYLLLAQHIIICFYAPFNGLYKPFIIIIALFIREAVRATFLP
jgi:hypothetical protein